MCVCVCVCVCVYMCVCVYVCVCVCVCVGVVYKWAMHKFLNSIHITHQGAMDLHYGCYEEEYFISPELEQVIENKASHTHNPHYTTSQYPTCGMVRYKNSILYFNSLQTK